MEPLDFPLAAGAPLPAVDDTRCAWHAEQRDGDRLLLRLGRQGDLLVAHDTRYGTLIAAADGSAHRFDPLPEGDPVLVAKFVASVVRALVRQLRGELSLHGSVVAFGGAAVAFVGPAFAGKSTFAHACVHYAQARLVADDTVALVRGAAEPTVLPVQRGTWLLAPSRDFFGAPPSAERKVLAELPRAEGPVPLRAVVILSATDGDGDDALDRVRGVEAFRVLTPHVFRFAAPEPEVHRRELDALADLAPRFAVYTYRRTRRFETLAAQVDRVRALVL